jgi:hypothetical protein
MEFVVEKRLEVDFPRVFQVNPPIVIAPTAPCSLITLRLTRYGFPFCKPLSQNNTHEAVFSVAVAQS